MSGAVNSAVEAAVIRVLSVEDSSDDAALILRALQTTGRTIELERVDTKAALRAALEGLEAWHVVLCDWSLPNLEGMDALRIVAEAGLDLPFIIVSGVLGEEAAVAAMRAGAHDFVSKDRLAFLAHAVEREIREARARRKQRETADALRASDARYRRIVETTTQGVWQLDAAMNTTFVNGRMAEMLRCSPEDLIGRSPTEFLCENGRAILARQLETYTPGAPAHDEVVLTRTDGTTFCAQVESAPLVDAAHQVEGGFAFVTDISARKAAEQALRTSEARFRGLWDSGIILVTISDVHGAMVDINEAGARMLGYSREELLATGLTWDSLTPPEWAATDARARAGLAKHGVSAPYEKELLRRDQSRMPILGAAAILDGSVEIGIAIDLTDRKRAEEALNERARVADLGGDIGLALTDARTLSDALRPCAQAMVDHMGAALARIWTLDATKKVLVLQASAGLTTELDGAQGRVPLGTLISGVIAQEKRPYATNDYARDPNCDPQLAEQEGIVSIAGHPLLVDGELVGVMAVYGRAPLSDVVVSGLGAIADTVAVGIQRKLVQVTNTSLEAQLRQAQKMEAVGRLAGGVAHDFNNVLSVILSYSELLLEDLAPADPMRGDLEEIQTAGNRAAELTRQLLMFSRQQVLEPRVLDLNTLLGAMEKMLQRVVGEDISLVFETASDVGRVRVDPGSIEQVIMNLVVNARDAMPRGGKVVIATRNVFLEEAYARDHVGVGNGAHIMLSVSDTGSGMSAETQTRIFEPFFTTKETGKGTGLGLSTVFGIMEQSGGSIVIESDLGKGATFKMYLPRVDSALDARRTMAPPSSLNGRETILVVEDEDQVREVACGILRRHGHEVLEARNAGEALLLCETHGGTIELLLTDVVMPHMSGPDLARRLSALRPTMKVLCMSGYTDDSIIRHGVASMGIAYLQKPLTPHGLMWKVRDVLDSALSRPRVHAEA